MIAWLRLSLPWFICLCHQDKHHSNPYTRKMTEEEKEGKHSGLGRRQKNLAHAPTQHVGAYYFTYIYKFPHGFPWPLQWRDLFKSRQSGLVAMEVMGAGNKDP